MHRDGRGKGERSSCHAHEVGGANGNGAGADFETEEPLHASQPHWLFGQW